MAPTQKTTNFSYEIKNWRPDLFFLMTPPLPTPSLNPQLCRMLPGLCGFISTCFSLQSSHKMYWWYFAKIYPHRKNKTRRAITFNFNSATLKWAVSEAFLLNKFHFAMCYFLCAFISAFLLRIRMINQLGVNWNDDRHQPIANEIICIIYLCSLFSVTTIVFAARFYIGC